MNVAILGCGPAGLLAAHAAALAGARVSIFSHARKSHLNGAQYLHSAIPGTPSADETPHQVSYQLQGSSHAYRMKVYGRMWDGTVSPDELDEDHAAWDIRATYDWLWDTYSPFIRETDIMPSTIEPLLETFDHVVSSVPAQAICARGHTFGATEIYAAGDAPGLGIRLSYSCPPDTVICNGEDNPSWYRLSNIFGHKTVEWPGSLRMAPPVKTAAKVTKPTFNNCDCWPSLHRVGRYGRWEKGVLSHQAFFDTYTLLATGGAA